MSASSDQNIQSTLASLEFNWKVASGKLSLNLQTKDFAEAVWVITEVAKAAEDLNHHPDILLQNYNQLSITLCTHSENAITSKDLSLAEKIDAIIARLDV